MLSIQFSYYPEIHENAIKSKIIILIEGLRTSIIIKTILNTKIIFQKYYNNKSKTIIQTKIIWIKIESKKNRFITSKY